MKGATANLLEIRDLKKHYPLYRGVLRRQYAIVKAVDGVSLKLMQGETLGVVGESGCGKTSLAKCVVRLEAATEGQVIFEGVDLCQASGESLRRCRKRLQMVFQDPYASLDPLMRVADIIAEPLIVHKEFGDSQELSAEVEALMMHVGLDPEARRRFPSEFSGGQRQRVAIARAISLKPSLVICDEPVSALDASTQSEIVDLLLGLQERYGLSYLLISHDLAVVRYMSNRIVVMYLGKVVEEAATEDLWSSPLHPYTQALLSALLVPEGDQGQPRDVIVLEGDVPSAASPPSGCTFHPRCFRYISGTCDREEPPLVEDSGHSVRCHLHAGGC